MTATTNPTTARTLLALLLAAALAGCPSASLPVDPDPVAAVTAYRDALLAGRPREAFAWIHPEAREGLDEAGFEALYARHRDALVAQAEERVRVARASPPRQRAKVSTDRGDVLLDKGPEGWRLLGPVGGSSR